MQRHQLARGGVAGDVRDLLRAQRRIDPARNMRRFYLLGVHGDLLAGWSVLREWGATKS
jgi:hypothetical protein